MKIKIHFLSRKKDCVFSRLNYRKCRLFILLVTIFYAFSVQNSYAQSIKQFDEVLNSMLASGQEQGNADAAYLKSLVYDVQPRIYVHGDGLKKISEKAPVCVTATPQSLELLYETNPLFEQVELITVKISNARDLNYVLDMTRFKSFSKLKYVHFLCNYDCDPALIRLQWPQASGSVIVFYQISLPE